MKFTLSIIIIFGIIFNYNLGSSSGMSDPRGIRIFGKNIEPNVASSSSSASSAQGEAGTSSAGKSTAETEGGINEMEMELEKLLARRKKLKIEMSKMATRIPQAISPKRERLKAELEDMKDEMDAVVTNIQIYMEKLERKSKD